MYLFKQRNTKCIHIPYTPSEATTVSYLSEFFEGAYLEAIHSSNHFVIYS